MGTQRGPQEPVELTTRSVSNRQRRTSVMQAETWQFVKDMGNSFPRGFRKFTSNNVLIWPLTLNVGTSSLVEHNR